MARLAVVLALVPIGACSSGTARPGGDPSVGVDSTGDGGATAWMPGDTETGPATTGAPTSNTSAIPSETGDDADAGTADDATGGSGPTLPCPDDPAACNAWFLAPGTDAWQAVTIGGPAALAPSSRVVAAFDTASQVHVLEVRYCFDFLTGEPYASFDPTALPSAPPIERVGGMLFNDTTGLVTFAGD